MKLRQYIRFGLFIGLLFLSIATYAQAQLKPRPSASKVGLNRAFDITYEFNGNVSEFIEPNFVNFKVLNGPNRAYNHSYINGRISQTTKYSYRLKALKEGTILLPQASVESNGKTIKSNPVSIQVIKGYRTDKEKEQDEFKAKLKEGIFIIPTVEKQNLKIGEAFVLSYKLYFNISLEAYDLIEKPNFNGFYTKEIPVDVRKEMKTETYKGKQYQTTNLAKYLLIPQKFGNIKVPDATYKFTVKTNQKVRDGFGWVNYKTEKVEIPVRQATLQIADLPKKGRPKSFNGAVGQFKFESSLSKNDAETNEAISLKLNISGKGNLKLFELPTLEFPSDFEVYDPKVSDNIKEMPTGMKGSKSYEYLLIPRYAGEYKLPSISFSYYDPSKNEYKQIETPEYEIKVKGEAKSENIIDAQKTTRQEGKSVDFIKDDIQYLDTKSGDLNTNSKGLYFNSGPFWIVNLLIFLLGLGLWLFSKRNSFSNKSSDDIRTKNASKVAKKYLGNAQNALNNQDKEAFYQAISKAIYQYTSDKLNLNNIDLNKSTLRQHLEQRSVSNDIISNIIQVLEKCDMARYAPSNNTEMQSLYQAVEKAIFELDNLV